MKNIKLWLMAIFAVSAVTSSQVFAQAVLSEKEVAAITEDAQETLNGFTWNLEVTSMVANKEDRVTTKDTVIFKDNKLNSSGLGEKGFGTSNYTLTVGDDGIPVFETMQRNERESTVFWRGELIEGKIRGVISVQDKDKPASSFGFRGERAGEVDEIPAEKIEPQPEPVPETVEVPVEAEVAVVAEESAEVVFAEEEEEAPAAEDEAVIAPVEEETKPVKQPWWAPKKN